MSTVVGPRLAPPTDVPLLRPGIDQMPRVCPAGHRGPHHAEPPMGTDRYGTVTCRTCGRLLAWVTSLPRTFALPAPVVTLRPEVVPTLPVPLSTAEWRLPGCTVACRPGHHSPEIHEEHGRALALAEIEDRVQRPTGIVRTGPLTVDFDAYCAYVDGAAIKLSPIEFRILSTLARTPGKACLYETLGRFVWGVAHMSVGDAESRTLRTSLTRLRARLGRAANLIQTVPTIGLRLLNEPVP